MAQLLKDELGAEVYKDHHSRKLPDWNKPYYLFAIVRNPYSREVSTWKHMKRTKINMYHKMVKYMTFDQYVAWRTKTKLVETNRLTQTRFVYGNNLELKDQIHIYKFEELHNVVFPFTEKKLPFINVGDIGDWKQYLTNHKTVQRINDYFYEDFQNFNYAKIS